MLVSQPVLCKRHNSPATDENVVVAGEVACQLGSGRFDHFLHFTAFLSFEAGVAHNQVTTRLLLATT